MEPILRSCFYALTGMTHNILRSFRVASCFLKVEVIIMQHSCCMWSDLHLISWTWKFDGRTRTRSHLSDVGWSCSFYFHYSYWQFWGWACRIQNMITFLDWNEVSCQKMQHQRTVYILTFPSTFSPLPEECYSDLSAFHKEMVISLQY